MAPSTSSPAKIPETKKMFNKKHVSYYKTYTNYNNDLYIQANL